MGINHSDRIFLQYLPIFLLFLAAKDFHHDPQAFALVCYCPPLLLTYDKDIDPPVVEMVKEAENHLFEASFIKGSDLNENIRFSRMRLMDSGEDIQETPFFFDRSSSLSIVKLIIGNGYKPFCLFFPGIP